MPVVGLFGPTASGKSDVAAAIADLIPAEVVSADAMQVYEGLPILTNRSAHPERLVGIWPLTHEASVGEYAPLAHAAVDEILAAGRTPVVAGGTGLYFRAALAELELPPRAAPKGHASAGSRSTTRRAPTLRTRVCASSTRRPRSGVHPNDRRRVVRALELADAGASLVPRRGQAVSRRVAASDPRRRARRARSTCSSARIARSDAADVRPRGRGRSPPSPRRRTLVDRAQGRSASTRSRRFPAKRRSRR